MKQICYISHLKKGDFFKLRENGKVYVRAEFDRSSKRYMYYDFDDVNNWHSATATRVVIVDFQF